VTSDKKEVKPLVLHADGIGMALRSSKMLRR
jgi:hypothetical protein